jgi:hypothetical protein
MDGILNLSKRKNLVKASIIISLFNFLWILFYGILSFFYFINGISNASGSHGLCAENVVFCNQVLQLGIFTPVLLITVFIFFLSNGNKKITFSYGLLSLLLLLSEIGLISLYPMGR